MISAKPAIGRSAPEEETRLPHSLTWYGAQSNGGQRPKLRRPAPDLTFFFPKRFCRAVTMVYVLSN